jgi:pimeloyl-ACP methyl ester carboxylesterase
MQHPIQIESAGGEYMDTVVVLEWAVPLGGAVKAGDTIVTVETAKAATEVEAPSDGYLVEICFEPGQEAPVGAVLGKIGESPDAAAPTAEAPDALAAANGAAAPVPAATPAVPAHETGAAALLEELRACRRIATPLARRVAQELGVDLAHVTGTGPHGRIKRGDVDAAARDAAAKARADSRPVAPASMARPSEVPRLAAPALDGPARDPIVLLHGFGADRASWRPLAGLLDRDHPLVMLELPGHGQAAPRTIASVEDLAFAVAEQLREKGIETAHVVGHSLGGAVAITLADLGLVAPRSLGLIAPGGLGPEINTAFIRGLADATRPEELQPWLETMVADPAVLPAGFANAVMRQRGNGGAALLALADALFGEGTQTMRLGHRLVRFEVPVKVIWGRRDRVIPSAHAAELPGHVGLHLLSGVGHMPHLEAPALVARLINELVHAGE